MEDTEIIEIDLQMVADEMVELFEFHVNFDDVTILGECKEAWREKLMDLVSHATPFSYLISEPALEHLEEELWPILIVTLKTRLTNIIKNFDQESKGVILEPHRSYSCEKDEEKEDIFEEEGVI